MSFVITNANKSRDFWVLAWKINKEIEKILKGRYEL